jgi:hypothetical protein
VWSNIRILRHSPLDTSAQRPDEGADARGKRHTPGAAAFVVIRESPVPWADNAPIIREDERYERINETGGDPVSPQDRALLDELGG